MPANYITLYCYAHCCLANVSIKIDACVSEDGDKMEGSETIWDAFCDEAR